MIPLSDSGVSSTRCSPKSLASPSVTRKTPPSLPTSSPITRTFGSSSIAARNPELSALASVIVVISRPSDARARKRPFGLERRVVLQVRRLLRLPLRRQLGVDPGKHPVRRRVRHGGAEGAEAGGELVGLGLHLVEEL